MKKLFLLFFLMTISLGQSQTLPLRFSEASNLMTGHNGTSFTIQPDDGDGFVGQIAGGTDSWDNSQLVLAQNVDLSDNANNSITFRIKPLAGTTSGVHLLKFLGGVAGPGSCEKNFYTTGSEWQTISVDFGAGLGNYSKLIIFTDAGADSNGYNNSETDTYLIDDIEGGTNVAPPAPPVLYNVTFKVDMNARTGFTAPEVRGLGNWDFLNAMTDANADGIWETTIS